jgi:integrase
MTTGLRQGELLGLTWDDGLDLEHARVRVHQQVQLMADAEGKLRPALTTPKSRAGRRWVPIPSFVVEALRAHRAGQQLQRAAAGPRWVEQGLVFPNAKGGPRDANALRRQYYQARDAAGLPPRRFHDLRHVYRSLLTQLGVHPSVAMRLMGHADLRMSAHYEHILDSAMTDAADRLDALLRTSAPCDATRSAGHPENDEL